jgi:phage I-like protein
VLFRSELIAAARAAGRLSKADEAFLRTLLAQGGEGAL